MDVILRIIKMVIRRRLLLGGVILFTVATVAIQMLIPRLFGQTIDRVVAIVGGEALFASNTSSLCITEMASVTTRPNRFLGLHFFSPVPVMSMVEVVKGLTTSDETYQIGIGFIQSIGKTAVSAPDQPGFIVNRLLIPYLLHAIRTYEAGLGTVDDIDKSMTLGCGHPMGPFELLDFVGLDTTYYIAQIMHDEFHDPSYSPPPLLKRMVLAGRLGRKSGRGFHIYS